MTVKSTEKANNRPRVVNTLETKFKFVAEFQASKWAVVIGHKHGIPSTTVQVVTIVVDQHNYKCVSKLAGLGIIKCLITR